jgi:outer membrane protein OmpA-like peptidoglycan-associated protein
MKVQNLFLTGVLLLAAGVTVFAQTVIESQTVQVIIAKRATLAVRYPDNDGTSVDIVGTALQPRIRGKAEVKRKEGRTRIKLNINHLDNPQNLGAFFTTYILWAVAPEGQADNIGELVLKGNESEIEVTTPYQNFGLIITAEPYGTVKMPSPTIVAENILREKTEGAITASQIEYRGDSGAFYRVANSDLMPDYSTPLVILGARRSVEIARRAGARRFAADELREAEKKLAGLEAVWVANRKHEERYGGEARDVMRLAEQARSLSVERFEQARLVAERRAANQAIAESQNEADRAKTDAERARLETEQAKSDAERARLESQDYRAALERAENALAAARKHVEQAQTEAERAKANEEVARLEAERAKLESQDAKQATDEARKQFEEVKRERDALQQRLFVSLSAILETRREARGLIVSLSDVLFDFNKASLKPGAREKLSKLAGILLAYPGKYQMEIEGHTDAIGTDEYNMKLSEDRAQSVRDYLNSAGIAADKIIAVRGFGKTRPVTTNDTAEGRQMNRRVEIVIADSENIPASVNGRNN